MPEADTKTKLTGGRVNYYLVAVTHPQREDQPAYQAECEDIIQALGMTFDEGCLFKALWRSAAARQGNGKPGQTAVYDAEEMVHYSGRVLRLARRQHDAKLTTVEWGSVVPQTSDNVIGAPARTTSAGEPGAADIAAPGIACAAGLGWSLREDGRIGVIEE